MAINTQAKPAAPLTHLLTTAIQFFTTGYTSVDSNFVSPYKPFCLLPADGKFEGRPFTVRASGVTQLGASAGVGGFTVSLAAGVTPVAGRPFRMDNAGSYFTPTGGTNVIFNSGALTLVSNAPLESFPWMIEVTMQGDSASGTLLGYGVAGFGPSSASTPLDVTAANAVSATNTTRASLVQAQGPTGLVFGPAALGPSFQNYDSQKTTTKTLGAGPGFYPGNDPTDPVIQFAVGITFGAAPTASTISNLLQFAIYE